MNYAAGLGYKIKLLGRARNVIDKISVYVAPHLISKDNLLASVDDVMNGVVVRGNAVGNVVFCGAGAGKLPTASAVVADVIDAVKHLHARRWISWADNGADAATDPALLESAWYIRTNAARERIEREFGNVMFAKETGSETVFITAVMSGKIVRDLLGRGITALSLFRVLGDY
jgi:homoserine dehydrogenase